MDLAPKRLTKQSFKQFAGEHPSVLPLKSPDIWSAIVFLIQECDLKKSKNLCSVQIPIYVLQYHYKEQNACLPNC